MPGSGNLFFALSSTSWPVIHVLWTKWQVFMTRNQAVNLMLSPTDGQKTVANVKLLIALFQTCLIFPDWLDSSEMISFGTWWAFELLITRYSLFFWLGHVVTDLMFHHSFEFVYLNIYYPASIDRLCKRMDRVYFLLQAEIVFVNAADGFLFDSSRNLTTSILNKKIRRSGKN